MELVERRCLIPAESAYFYTCMHADESHLPPTEQSGPNQGLEAKSIEELVAAMHGQTQSAFDAVSASLEPIQQFIEALVPRMKKGGRLFYIGAGTSGRLGVLDASECPPTFGVDPSKVQGWIAGGDGALRVAVEGAEDDPNGAWNDLASAHPTPQDTLIGIAASGRTPYVVGGLKAARKAGLLTACITCNPDSAVVEVAEHPMVAVTGPEFVTGSTRLNAGTATKLILNLISTTAMIQLGHVVGSKMVDMKPSNAKLQERGIRMIQEATGASVEEAASSLQETNDVRASIEQLNERG